MSKYPYTKLNLPEETRILTLLPSTNQNGDDESDGSQDEDDPLICSLMPLDLTSAHEPFTALSYCWNSSTTATPPDPALEIPCAVYDPTGEKSDARTVPFRELVHYPHYKHLYYMLGGRALPGTIVCDGLKLSVGGELYNALKRLRKKEKVLRIWVDALCINQDDIPERNEHVKMMQQIYAKAEEVHIWLGEMGAGLTRGGEIPALEAVTAVSSFFEEMFRATKVGETDGQLRSRIQHAFMNDDRIRGLDWDAIAALLSRAWVCGFLLLLEQALTSD